LQPLDREPFSAAAWQVRFAQQARWTRDLRDSLFRRYCPRKIARVLEVGCGPAALTAEIALRTGAQIYGLDREIRFLSLAQRTDPRGAFVAGDAHSLPFHARSFDLAYCHFLLLWMDDPVRSLAEMARVTARGGLVLALAEPDYSGRIDHPEPLAELGRLQSEALAVQGADPTIGRRLGELFYRAGLVVLETGLLGGKWSGEPSAESWQSEWQVLESDLQGRIDLSRLAELRRLDAAAWQRGERVLFVPTFYAVGQVK
jgi:ubiquinone/menaquinone biosynthesis C-methylase UbiE